MQLHVSLPWWLLCSGTAELFATCAKKDIRVWHTLTNRELLRITVPNMTCHGIDFMRDGKSIISGKVLKREALNQKELGDRAGLALLQKRMTTCSLGGPCVRAGV